MKKEIVIFIGGQGVGKGTFSTMLRSEREFNYIETGAIFRALPSDSEIAKLIAGGNLVPDEKLFELIGSKIDDASDTLIDGFPRTLPQAQWLIDNYRDKFDIQIIYLNVPKEIMLKRIAKRLATGGGRADDADANAVCKRLDSFFEKTMPVIEWLRNNDQIFFADIDVSGTVDENFARIKTALNI